MEDGIELNLLKKAKSITECAKIIKGIDYTNGRIKREIIEYCFFHYNLDILKVLNDNREKKCLNCGKVISGRRKFCNSSCAAKYNNSRRTLSDETKLKISNTLRIRHHGSTEKWSRKNIKCVCETCGKEFYSYKQSRFCSSKCSCGNEQIKEKIKEKVLKRIENGTFSGWKTRNIKSYPEIFWEGVLQGNSINFEREDFSTKKYFLDFLIEKNGKKIDLEIDGKQHLTRKEHDAERDSFLREQGFIVYRIEWNSINSIEGKTLMKEKIDKFLKFYKSI